ncbi:MAG: 4-(cytidine 5'-diphospho)-2-C-methyl-D-erythritol kinase [Rhodovarius sp.]|nr:4-(cytidine 5'-diphospho)-2-C-methyl-D-erythritol kinase [Rhodovarius sp.]MDW8315271.1 4-(cytidine 5'-diphospho)-2-C-methyl-D-erythritol kinase [Rhodovarius sp.]
MTLHEPAPAKINLFLHVTGRRADGYHLLDSLAVFGPAADALEVEPAPVLSLHISGPFREGLEEGADNLVLRAAVALARHEGRENPGARLHLIKNLPLASGMGGGSADAAATLRLLNRLWGLGLGPAVLEEIAQRLGADVPVCIRSRPARMQGIGEAIGPAPRLPKGLALLVVNPRLPVPTAAVFAQRQGGFSAPAELPAGWISAAAMAEDLRRCRNDLEPAAIALCPAIRDVLAAIAAQPGCLLARMSGSGATCFGLFARAEEAHAAMLAMPRSWWCAAGPLAPPAL